MGERTVWNDEKIRMSDKKIDQFGASVLVVSLGVDTFEEDPISFFRLKSDDFLKVGELIKPPSTRKREDLKSTTEEIQLAINSMLDAGLIKNI